MTDFSGSCDNINAVAIQVDGKIIAAGSTSEAISCNLQNFAIARYNLDGSLDSTFGSEGKVVTHFSSYLGGAAFALAIQADGKFVTVGYADKPGAEGRFFVLARYNLDGSLDISFGTDGIASVDFGPNRGPIAYGLTIQPDGKLVAAGVVTGGLFREWDFALARFHGDRPSQAILAYYDLGDSVASGHGLEGDSGEGCRQSPGAYPRFVASLLSNDQRFKERYAKVLDRGPIACSGKKSRDLWEQVDAVLADWLELRDKNQTVALVSITIGANDFDWANLILSGQLNKLLCGPDKEFNKRVKKVTTGVRVNVQDQIQRLVDEEDVYVIVTNYHNPFNTKSDVIPLGGAYPCPTKPKLSLSQLYNRTEIGTHQLNSALKMAIKPHPKERVKIDSVIHASFHGRESPQPWCGDNPPDEDDTWIQFPEILGGEEGWDCFHPNSRGADAYAQAVYSIAVQLLVTD